jgi:hypothetical protein
MNALVSIPYGLGFRNIVTCGVLASLARAGVHCEVRLPALAAEDLEILRAQFPEGTRVGHLHPVKHSRAYAALKMLKQHHYAERTGLSGFKVRRERRRVERPGFHALASAAESVSRVLLPEPAVDRLLASMPQPHAATYLEELRASRPDVVVVTKPGYHPDELPLVCAARRLGIPTIAVDTTWDNMASKRPPYVRTDQITVWNARMAREATSYYGFSADAVEMTGGTQFDVLFEPPRESRTDLCTRLGLDPGEPLVLFTLNNPSLTPGVPQQIALLVALRESGALGCQPNLVFRLHPWDAGDAAYRTALAGHARTCLDRPFLAPRPGSGFESLPRPDDVTHYGSLLRHVDVLINVASTTSLDAVAVDCPVVNIAFDTIDVAPEASVANYYGYAHYKPIVDSGAAVLALSKAALADALRLALRDRTVGAAARAAARREFLTFEDGAAHARVAARICRAGGREVAS